MISIIISSYKEPKTIGKAIISALNFSKSDIHDKIEIIQVSPDEETLQAGLSASKKACLSSDSFIQIRDPQKGKPHALNLAFKRASGDVIILTDGDVFFSPNAINQLIKALERENIGGVSGRPLSFFPPRSTKWGFYSSLLADAAHYKRQKASAKAQFFPMSGYIMAVKKDSIKNLILPDDVLSDDAYISYFIANKGYEIGYAPNAIANIKYPDNIKDYYKQKVRSLGGYTQLKKYNILNNIPRTRTFFDEAKLAWFPISYAKTLKEFFWALQLYFIRLATWAKIFYTQKIRKRDFSKIWTRVESTK